MNTSTHNSNFCFQCLSAHPANQTCLPEYEILMAGKDQAGKEHNACVKVFAPNHEIAAELWAEMYDEVSGGFQIASSQWNPRVFVKGPDGRIKALKISAQSMVGYIAEELKI